jgi:hypothetical protein
MPDRSIRIADVAGGHGKLQAALRQSGYTNVLSIDKRRKYASGRIGYRYGLFSCEVTEVFDLVVGMHPDEATDHIVIYGHERKVPWVVCPCCVRPSAYSYGDRANDYHRWMAHLRALGGGPKKVRTFQLPMDGRNTVLVGNC